MDKNEHDGVEGLVKAIVSRITKVSPERLTADTDLRVDLNVDSLQGLQIVAAVERTFDITVPPEEIDNYSSVRAIVETIERVRAEPPAQATG